MTLRTHLSERKYIRNRLLSKVYPAQIPAGGLCVGEKALKLDLNLQEAQNYLFNCPSVHGMLIECIYYIEISAITEGLFLCCGQNPEIDSVCEIIPNEIINPLAIQPPVNWNPQSYSQYSIEYDQRFESLKPLKNAD